VAPAAIASLGAGAVHAAAIGVHAEHAGLARLFVAAAVLQLGAGLVGLVRPSRPTAAAIAAVNALAVAGWLTTRLAGISWIGGLEAREAPGFADSACAGLGLVATGAALAALLVGWQPARPPRLLLPALAAAALAVPAMVSGGTDVHSHGSAAGDAAGHAHAPAAGGDGAAPGAQEGGAHDGAAHDEIPHGHEAATGDAAAAPPVAGEHDDGHGHAAEPVASEAARPWPRPWDPAAGIDVSGVPGVTPDQEARATALVEQSLLHLPKYADPAAAVADGYVSIGDAGTGSEHYIKGELIFDDVILDPTAPESLVYTAVGDQRTLAGAMYIASPRPADDPSLTEFAGPLMQWHRHDDLCWEVVDGQARVVGLIDDSGACARGTRAGGENPMVHVWITPHPCGVFAALEGVGAGTATVSDAERVDMCEEVHGEGHGAGHDDGPATVPYDPSKPIDLGGVPGVTPEQQAAAENLVAINVVRLPRWADDAVAEAAGFRSIGDAGTGHEHLINWAWIDDDVFLDPDHPESLVYRPGPDGTRELVSAMYMLPPDVGLDEVPDIGGALMQWHVHEDLCFTRDPEAPKVAAVIRPGATCPAGTVPFQRSPMIHVWIVPHACGPFAALDGVGAGQVAPGETTRCDHAHGAPAT